MKRSRFSDEQIIAILKEQEAGMPTAEVCRRHGISPATFYKWKAKYGGLEVSEAKRLRSLEDENAKLKKLLAEAGFVDGEDDEHRGFRRLNDERQPFSAGGGFLRRSGADHASGSRGCGRRRGSGSACGRSHVL